MATAPSVIETIRAQFRPERVLTLFVGESAPHSGDFFYSGNTQMLRYMRHAVEEVLGKSDDFLETFKAYGWFLDDLVLTPVNHIKEKSLRRAKCLEAQGSLATRIAAYQPKAIVSLLKSIEPFVTAAAEAAGSNAIHHTVHFPGMGQQTHFHDDMISLIPSLPRISSVSK